MKVLVHPIIQSVVDWENFLFITRTVLNRQVHFRDDKDLYSFIVALGEMRRTPSLLRHLFFGFMITASEQNFQRLVLESGLNAVIVASGNTDLSLGLVTGNLEQWRTATINCCTEDEDPELRTIFNLVLQCFEAAGLSKVWFNFSKTMMPDKTFKLEPNRY